MIFDAAVFEGPQGMQEIETKVNFRYQRAHKVIASTERGKPFRRIFSENPKLSIFINKPAFRDAFSFHQLVYYLHLTLSASL